MLLMSRVVPELEDLESLLCVCAQSVYGCISMVIVNISDTSQTWECNN